MPTQTQLSSLNATLPSYFGTDAYEIEITVISSTLNVETTIINSQPANVKFELIVDLPKSVRMAFPPGQTTSDINYKYDPVNFELVFELTFMEDTRADRSAHQMKIDFTLPQSEGIRFLSFTEDLNDDRKKKKAVSADPSRIPFIPKNANNTVAPNLGEQIKNVKAIQTIAVYNDWDIYVESNHYCDQGQTGAKVFMNLILDIPAGGVFNGLSSCSYDANKHCINFVFNKSNNGGSSNSSLVAFSIIQELAGVDPDDVHYYSFRFSDENKKKKVVSADPTNRPKK